MKVTEIKAGTRVTTAVGRYASQFGTVQEVNRGTVTNTDHENFGRAFVSVKWDPTPSIPWGEYSRPFVDELTVVEDAATDEAADGSLTLEEALEYADQMHQDTTVVGLPDWPKPAATCRHGNTPRPDVTGDPIAACAKGDGGTEWGAFSDEGCYYDYDCAVDVANESANQNEEAEADADDPVSTWGEMCRDHRDQEQPLDGCEECNAETADEDDDQGESDEV